MRRADHCRRDIYTYNEVWSGGTTLVQVLGVRFMNDEDIGQTALDVEVAVLIQGYFPSNRMTHRSTSDAVKDLSGHKLESRLRTWRVLQLLYPSRD